MTPAQRLMQHRPGSPADEVSRPNPRVTAVIPAYDAADHIAPVIAGLEGRVDTIIVVNDGSSDATAEVARNAGALVVDHETNQGLGCALRTGFSAAIASDAELVVTLDADGQHSPDDIGRVLSRLIVNHCEMVIGSRLTDHSQFEKFPPMRLYGNLLLTWMTNVAAGAQVTTDSQSGYRAFTRGVLERIDLTSTHMAISSEIVLEVAQAGFRIAEVPIGATYEDEVSAQRFFTDPATIMWMLAARWVRRLTHKPALGSEQFDQR